MQLFLNLLPNCKRRVSSTPRTPEAPCTVGVYEEVLNEGGVGRGKVAGLEIDGINEVLNGGCVMSYEIR